MASSSSWTRRALAAALWVVLCLVPAAAAAGPAQDFKRHYEQGLRLYQEEHYGDAISEFSAAYEIQQLPRLLYNLGRAHFKLGHAQDTVDFLERFLKLEPDAPPEVIARANETIEQARAMLATAARLKNGGPPAPEPEKTEPAKTEPAPGPQPVVVAPPPVAAPPPVVTPPRPAPRPERLVLGRPLWRVATGATATAAGLVLAGLGAGALGVNGHCVNPAVPPALQCDQTFNSLSPGAAMLSVGLVVAGGGVALALWPYHAPSHTKD